LTVGGPGPFYRLLGVLTRREDGNWLVLVDCGRCE